MKREIKMAAAEVEMNENNEFEFTTNRGNI